MIAQLLNGLALGSLFMILSSGLAMIYGLRGIANFAHGGLYMLGAYIAFSFSSVSFWLALLIAPIALAAIGAVLELVFFRRLQHRTHIEVGLLTFGLALIIQRIVTGVWGLDTHTVPAPPAFDGTLSILGSDYPTYRLVIIVIAIALAIGLVAWLRYSRMGLHVRAASHDLSTGSLLGINVDRLSLVVVCVGCGLAGAAGVLAAPYLSVSPNMDATVLTTVLIIVVVGGIGSIGGAMIAGMGLGILQTIGSAYVPSVALLLPYIALVVVLLFRPKGIAGRRAT